MNFFGMLLFFLMVLVVGSLLYKSKFLMKTPITFYVTYSLLFVLSGIGIIVSSKETLRLISVFILALSLFVLYLKLNSVFRKRLTLMEAGNKNNIKIQKK